MGRRRWKVVTEISRTVNRTESLQKDKLRAAQVVIIKSIRESAKWTRILDQ